MRNLHTQLKEPSERIWFLWGHMFSCSVRIWNLEQMALIFTFCYL